MLRTSEWYFHFWIAHYAMWAATYLAQAQAGNTNIAARCAQYATEAQANAIGYASR